MIRYLDGSYLQQLYFDPPMSIKQLSVYVNLVLERVLQKQKAKSAHQDLHLSIIFVSYQRQKISRLREKNRKQKNTQISLSSMINILQMTYEIMYRCTYIRTQRQPCPVTHTRIHTNKNRQTNIHKHKQSRIGKEIDQLYSQRTLQFSIRDVNGKYHITDDIYVSTILLSLSTTQNIT